MGLVQKAFSDIITFSRSSNATRVGPTGLVEYAPHNLVLQSQTIDNASWTKTDASVTANAAAAPDGTITADLLYPSTSGTYRAIVQGPSGVSGAVYTASFYVKASGFRWVVVGTVAGANVGAYFDLQNGLVGTVAAGVTASITSVGNGWYRCSATSTSASATIYSVLTVVDADGGITATASGTNGVYVWGAQLSVGPYPLEYTPTTSAAVYGPRFDYDPVTLAARGLLIEESRSNLLTYSEQFDNAAWTKARSSITANAATSPSGTVTADQSTIDNTNGFHDACYQTFSATSGTSYTFSIFVKKNVGIEAVYFYTDATSPGAIAKFNLTTGAYIGNAPGNGYSAFTSYSSTALSNGWYRIVATVTAASTNPSTFFTIGMSTNTNDTVAQFTGNGTDNFYLWGAQLEAGSFATSYIPTLASSVTRSADVASVNTLSPWYNATEGTLFAEFVLNGVVGKYARAVAFSDGTNGDTIEIRSWEPTSSMSFTVVDGSANQCDITTSAPVANTIYKYAGAYKVNDFAASKNGGTVGTDTSGTIPTVDRLIIGRSGASDAGTELNGWMRRIAYYPRRLTNAELQSLTA